MDKMCAVGVSDSGNQSEQRRTVVVGELLDRRHFHEHFDTDAYLKDFYARVDDAAMQMVLFHLPNIVARLGPLPSLLDFGSGPTIHVSVCFRETVDEIYLADYLPQNRAELSRWLDGQSDFDWSAVLRIIAGREAVPFNEMCRMEQKAREKIRAILFCDCHVFPAVQIPDKIRHDKTFAAITTFFTLEYCCLSRYEYALAINHLSAHLGPNGVLIMGGVLEETWCAFGGRQFKCLFVSRQLMIECLRGAGLTLERDQLDNELFYELDGMYILVDKENGRMN
uniref:Nicotinamide N-methyltransferase-like n=1 Tax=Globodera pallida TaxID=36090 RepID=A0A183BNP1_GLOPA